MLLQKSFYTLDALREVGIPQAPRTLRNLLRGGVIHFGPGQPPLKVTRIGGRVVVSAVDLACWLQQMGGLPPGHDPAPAPAPAKRPGRPRKPIQGGGGA